MQAPCTGAWLLRAGPHVASAGAKASFSQPNMSSSVVGGRSRPGGAAGTNGCRPDTYATPARRAPASPGADGLNAFADAAHATSNATCVLMVQCPCAVSALQGVPQLECPRCHRVTRKEFFPPRVDHAWAACDVDSALVATSAVPGRRITCRPDATFPSHDTAACVCKERTRKTRSRRQRWTQQWARAVDGGASE